MWRGAPGKWSGLHPVEPGGLLEKPLADWRGRAPQALPTKSSKDRCQNTSAPKARRGAAGNEPQEDLGEGGAPGPPKGKRGSEGGLQTQPGRRLAQCFQRRSIPGQPDPPRPAPLSSSRPVLTEAPRQLRAPPPPRRFLPSRRAVPRPGREVSGFRLPSPASLLPPAARGPRARSKAEEL